VALTFEIQVLHAFRPFGGTDQRFGTAATGRPGAVSVIAGPPYAMDTTEPAPELQE
jgi:hypothetical protein